MRQVESKLHRFKIHEAAGTDGAESSEDEACVFELDGLNGGGKPEASPSRAHFGAADHTTATSSLKLVVFRSLLRAVCNCHTETHLQASSYVTNTNAICICACGCLPIIRVLKAS
eukprot:1882131-Amphidinium_carterae.1